MVEDDSDVLAMYVTLLRLEGADVTAAATGRQALAQSRAGVFDVVLSDLNLSDIPGEILIRVLRAADRRLGVLVVTGGSEQDQTEAYDAGADMVFPKPVEWASVLKSLAGLASPRAA